MKGVRLIANVLFFITRLAAILYGIVGLYTGIILGSIGNTSPSSSLAVIEDGTFTIFLPFTGNAFLVGDFTNQWIINTLVTIFLYAIFLWLLSDVFNSFRKERLFTKGNVSRLTRFYLYNLIVPITAVITLSLLNQDMDSVIVIALLHFLAGIFAFFMAVIFKQGFVLQQEQDLTL